MAAWERSVVAAVEARPFRTDFVRFLHSECSGDSDFDASELIFGELIGNAIRYAPGAVRIAFSWQGDRGELSVFDTGTGFAPSSGMPDENSESGRGLIIVRELALGFSVECTTIGCEVRVILPITRR